MNSGLFSEVKERIRKEMVESGIPSFAIAVAHQGKILWEEAFGWADREKRIPASEHTLYSLASISKPFTATGLMKLVEQGKLDLDKPVNHYLPENSRVKVWIGDPEEVTVRRLANHTAGLPLHYHFFPSDEPYPKPPMEESVRRYGNVVSPPGERCRYSNIGYGILDYLIERLSGTSYSDFMRREVFLPLGMNHSSVDIGPGLEGFQAIRYSDNGLALPFYDFDHRGASAVFSSAHDLVRFAMCHLKQLRQDQKAILSDESIEAMQVPTASMGSPSPADPNLRTRSGYGTGWVIDDDELDYRVSHGGGMGGVATKLLLLPREGIAVAALANTGCQLPYKIEGDILSVLLPGYAARLAERQAKKTGEAANVPASEFQAVPELLGNWRGVVQTYKGTLPMELSFKPSGDIHARLKDQLWALLNDARLMDGRLSGKMLGNIGTEDANRRPYDLHLDLKLRGNVLNGSITAISLPTRLGNALSHWVEVKKDQ